MFFRNKTTCFFLKSGYYDWVIFSELGFSRVFSLKKVTQNWVEVWKSGVFSIPLRFQAFPTPIRSISVSLSYKTAGSRCLAMDGCFVPFFGRCFPTSKRVKADFDRMVCERIPKAIQWLMGASLGFVFLYGQKMLRIENYTCNLCRIFRILHFWRVNEHMSQLVWRWWRGFSVRWVTEDMRHYRRSGFQPAKTTIFHEILILYRWSFRSLAPRQLCSDQNAWAFAVYNRLYT